MTLLPLGKPTVSRNLGDARPVIAMSHTSPSLIAVGDGRNVKILSGHLHSSPFLELGSLVVPSPRMEDEVNNHIVQMIWKMDCGMLVVRTCAGWLHFINASVSIHNAVNNCDFSDFGVYSAGYDIKAIKISYYSSMRPLHLGFVDIFGGSRRRIYACGNDGHVLSIFWNSELESEFNIHRMVIEGMSKLSEWSEEEKSRMKETLPFPRNIAFSRKRPLLVVSFPSSPYVAICLMPDIARPFGKINCVLGALPNSIAKSSSIDIDDTWLRVFVGLDTAEIVQIPLLDVLSMKDNDFTQVTDEFAISMCGEWTIEQTLSPPQQFGGGDCEESLSIDRIVVNPFGHGTVAASWKSLPLVGVFNPPHDVMALIDISDGISTLCTNNDSSLTPPPPPPEVVDICWGNGAMSIVGSFVFPNQGKSGLASWEFGRLSSHLSFPNVPSSGAMIDVCLTSSSALILSKRDPLRSNSFPSLSSSSSSSSSLLSSSISVSSSTPASSVVVSSIVRFPEAYVDKFWPMKYCEICQPIHASTFHQGGNASSPSSFLPRRPLQICVAGRRGCLVGEKKADLSSLRDMYLSQGTSFVPATGATNFSSFRWSSLKNGEFLAIRSVGWNVTGDLLVLGCYLSSSDYLSAFGVLSSFQSTNSSISGNPSSGGNPLLSEAPSKNKAEKILERLHKESPHALFVFSEKKDFDVVDAGFTTSLPMRPLAIKFVYSSSDSSSKFKRSIDQKCIVQLGSTNGNRFQIFDFGGLGSSGSGFCLLSDITIPVSSPIAPDFGVLTPFIFPSNSPACASILLQSVMGTVFTTSLPLCSSSSSTETESYTIMDLSPVPVEWISIKHLDPWIRSEEEGGGVHAAAAAVALQSRALGFYFCLPSSSSSSSSPVPNQQSFANLPSNFVPIHLDWRSGEIYGIIMSSPSPSSLSSRPSSPPPLSTTTTTTSSSSSTTSSISEWKFSKKSGYLRTRPTSSSSSSSSSTTTRLVGSAIVDNLLSQFVTAISLEIAPKEVNSLVSVIGSVLHSQRACSLECLRESAVMPLFISALRRVDPIHWKFALSQLCSIVSLEEEKEKIPIEDRFIYLVRSTILSTVSSSKMPPIHRRRRRSSTISLSVLLLSLSPARSLCNLESTMALALDICKLSIEMKEVEALAQVVSFVVRSESESELLQRKQQPTLSFSFSSTSTPTRSRTSTASTSTLLPPLAPDSPFPSPSSPTFPLLCTTLALTIFDCDWHWLLLLMRKWEICPSLVWNCCLEAAMEGKFEPSSSLSSLSSLSSRSLSVFALANGILESLELVTLVRTSVPPCEAEWGEIGIMRLGMLHSLFNEDGFVKFWVEFEDEEEPESVFEMRRFFLKLSLANALLFSSGMASVLHSKCLEFSQETESQNAWWGLTDVVNCLKEAHKIAADNEMLAVRQWCGERLETVPLID